MKNPTRVTLRTSQTGSFALPPQQRQRSRRSICTETTPCWSSSILLVQLFTTSTIAAVLWNMMIMMMMMDCPFSVEAFVVVPAVLTLQRTQCHHNNQLQLLRFASARSENNDDGDETMPDRSKTHTTLLQSSSSSPQFSSSVLGSPPTSVTELLRQLDAAQVRYAPTVTKQELQDLWRNTVGAASIDTVVATCNSGQQPQKNRPKDDGAAGLVSLSELLLQLQDAQISFPPTARRAELEQLLWSYNNNKRIRKTQPTTQNPSSKPSEVAVNNDETPPEKNVKKETRGTRRDTTTPSIIKLDEQTQEQLLVDDENNNHNDDDNDEEDESTTTRVVMAELVEDFPTPISHPTSSAESSSFQARLEDPPVTDVWVSSSTSASASWEKNDPIMPRRKRNTRKRMSSQSSPSFSQPPPNDLLQQMGDATYRMARQRWRQAQTWWTVDDETGIRTVRARRRQPIQPPKPQQPPQERQPRRPDDNGATTTTYGVRHRRPIIIPPPTSSSSTASATSSSSDDLFVTMDVAAAPHSRRPRKRSQTSSSSSLPDDEEDPSFRDRHHHRRSTTASNEEETATAAPQQQHQARPLPALPPSYTASSSPYVRSSSNHQHHHVPPSQRPRQPQRKRSSSYDPSKRIYSPYSSSSSSSPPPQNEEEDHRRHRGEFLHDDIRKERIPYNDNNNIDYSDNNNYFDNSDEAAFRKDAVDRFSELFSSAADYLFYGAYETQQQQQQQQQQQAPQRRKRPPSPNSSSVRRPRQPQHWKDHMEERFDRVFGIHETGDFYQSWNQSPQTDKNIVDDDRHDDHAYNNSNNVAQGRRPQPKQKKQPLYNSDKPIWSSDNGGFFLSSLFFGSQQRRGRRQPPTASPNNRRFFDEESPALTPLFPISERDGSVLRVLGVVGRAGNGLTHWASVRGTIPQSLVLLGVAMAALTTPRRPLRAMIVALVALRTLGEVLVSTTEWHSPYDDSDDNDNYQDEYNNYEQHGPKGHNR